MSNIIYIQSFNISRHFRNVFFPNTFQKQLLTVINKVFKIFQNIHLGRKTRGYKNRRRLVKKHQMLAYFKHKANLGKQYTWYSAEAYSEHCQTSKIKFFAKIVNNFQSQKAPYWIFDKVLNTPLFRALVQ